MNKFELSVSSSTTDARISLKSENTSLCWYCKEDSIIDIKNENLISPCRCVNDFIHIHCLEFLANTRNILDCPRCNAQYPLEIRRKSLLKMLWKVCDPFFIIIYLIFSYFMFGGLTIYSLLSIIQLINNSIDLQDIDLLSVTMKIINIPVYCVFFYVTLHKISDSSKTISQLYDQWYNSSKLKYKKQ